MPKKKLVPSNELQVSRSLAERLHSVVFPLGNATKSIEDAIRGWPDVLVELVIELLSSAPHPYPDVAKALRQHTTYTLTADTEDAISKFANLRPFLAERAAKRTLPEPEDYVPLNVNDVAHWLEPNGPCARILDGYEYRAGQVQMAREVAQAFNGRKHLLMEAGTGIGKSVGYLVPAILWSLKNKVPVVISTNTKNLQAQLFHKDIPMLRNVIQTDFRAALIKGRTNYVCLRKVVYLLEHREAELEPSDFVTLAQVLIWVVATTTGDLNEIDGLLSSTLRSKRTSSGEE